MAKQLAKSGNVAYLNADHPAAKEGAGYYEVLQDNEHTADLNDNGDSVNVEFTNTDVKFGERLLWQKVTPDKEGEPNNPENNEGKFVYASSVSEPQNNGTAEADGGDEG